MPIPTVPMSGIVIDKLTYPVKKLLGFAAKNSIDAQAKSGKEILQDLITGNELSFYSWQTRDGGNEIDTYLYGTPYNTKNTSNIGPSYDTYLSKNFPLRKYNVKTYDSHFGDTLYIDEKWKDQVLDELEQGKTVGASMGRYAHAPSYIVNTKDDQRRPYDAGGHLMQFQYDKDGNVIANMSDIYDFLPEDFEEKYGAVKEYGPLKTAGMYAMHHLGTPFIVRQNNIPVRFKEIVPKYETEWQKRLGDFLSQWGNYYDLTIPLDLKDDQIEEIFSGREYGDDILDFMQQKGYLKPSFKKGGRIHIKKKNRGKFTEYCGGKVTEECIAKGKKSKDPKIRKRATFAANARKWKHESGGILKAQEGINELYPAGIAIPSNETIDFFKDFAQRYKKFNGINKNQLISSLISKDKAIVLKRGLPTYNTENKQIFIPSDDVGVSTYSHELVHKLNDLVLERTNKERKLLNDAYPLSIAKHVYGRAPEDMRNELIEDERFSTNTELRRKISSDYGNILGKKLNKVIKSLSTNDIINYVNNINGYVGESDFLKYPEHIIDGKTLFEHWKEDIGDVPEYYNMPWEELPKSKQDQWQYLYDSREGVAPNYMIFDEDKPKAIKKALIKVAQESKSNDIRSKNFINVSRQGGILKAQEGTGNLLIPHPLSPVGIALNQAKAMAKGKTHLPPGVKEVIGPDGKKVAIRTEQPLAPMEQSIAEWMPGTGDVAEVGYMADDIKNGRYGTAALSAGLMFIPGNAGKLLSKYRKTVSKTADAVEDAVRKADVSEYINTVDDALPERQPLTISKSKQFWDGTSESKLTDAEKAGVPKGERNQPVKVKTYYERDIIPLLSAEYTQRFGAPPLDPDYLETSSLQRAKYQRLMNNKFENIFDNTEDFNKTLQSYIDGLPNEIDPRFTSTTDGEIIQPSIAVRGYRNYLLNNGVDAVDISDDDLARLLTQEYKNLSNTATGKLKNTLLWHGSPTQFESFDFSKTSANTGNSGALGPGNYFSTHGGRYGHTRSKIDNSLEMNNFQPYIVSNITSTPAGHDMIEKGLLPKFIDSYAMRSAKNQAILQKWISEIPTNDNRAYIDFTEAVNGYFNGPRAGIMIRRNTGIKSLYPHPSRFVRNADGTVTLIPTDWNDTRVNFKEGGKL